MRSTPSVPPGLPAPGSAASAATAHSLHRDAMRAAKRCLGPGTRDALAEGMAVVRKALDYCSACNRHHRWRNEVGLAEPFGLRMEECFWALMRLREVADRKGWGDCG